MMYNDTVKCPVCGEIIDFKVRNITKIKEPLENATCNIIEKVDKNIFKCRITIKCLSCRMSFETIKNITINN